MERNGDKIILQIVQPSVENVLDNFEGETLMKWKNLSLKRLEGSDVCIWQMTDVIGSGRQREIDSSLFLPKIDAVIVFYDIKDKTVVVEWLRIVAGDIRFKEVTLFIVGCYQKGEPTVKFEELFENEDQSRIFLWRIDNKEEIVTIYESILNIL